MALATTIGLILATMSVSATLTQTIRTLKTRNIEGLSLTTQVCWVASWALWLIYSINIGAQAKIISESTGLIADIILLSLLAKTLPFKPKPYLVAFIGSIVCILAWRFLGLQALAASLTVFDAMSLAPALIAAFKSGTAEGVSIRSWYIRSLTAAGWILYAVAIHYPLAAGWAWVMAPASLALAVKVQVARNQAKKKIVSSIPLQLEPVVEISKPLDGKAQTSISDNGGALL